MLQQHLLKMIHIPLRYNQDSANLAHLVEQVQLLQKSEVLKTPARLELLSRLKLENPASEPKERWAYQADQDLVSLGRYNLHQVCLYLYLSQVDLQFQMVLPRLYHQQK